MEGGLQGLGLRVQQRDVVGLEVVADVLDGGLDLLLGGRVERVLHLLDLPLGLVRGVLGRVARLDQLALAPVVLGVRLGVLDHPLDLFVGEARAGLDLDLLLLAGAEILGADVEDAVRVDVERDLDLRHSARRRRDAGQLELAERLVVRGHLALALEHVDLDARLVVLGRGEDLRLAGRDRRVALDQLGHHAALGLDAEGQRGDVEQQHVLDVAGQHAGLDRGADGDDLVGVHAPVRVLAGQLLDLLLDGGHARHAAHEDDVVDAGAALDAGVGRAPAWSARRRGRAGPPSAR